MKSTKSLAHGKHEIRVYSYGDCEDFLLIEIVLVSFARITMRITILSLFLGHRLVFFSIIMTHIQEDVRSVAHVKSVNISLVRASHIFYT